MNFGARYHARPPTLRKTSDGNAAYPKRARLRKDDSCNYERGSDGRARRAPLTLDNRWARSVRRQRTSRLTTGATRSADGWSAPMARYSQKCPRLDLKARYKSAPT